MIVHLRIFFGEIFFQKFRRNLCKFRQKFHQKNMRKTSSKFLPKTVPKLLQKNISCCRVLSKNDNTCQLLIFIVLFTSIFQDTIILINPFSFKFKSVLTHQNAFRLPLNSLSPIHFALHCEDGAEKKSRRVFFNLNTGCIL